MDRQQSRRLLVVAIYAFLGACCAANVLTMPLFPAGFSYVFWAVILVSTLIFGGGSQFQFGRYRGLLKPFNNRPPRPESVQSELIRIRLQPQSVPPQDMDWRNDERELARRDNAHYRAYAVPLIPVLLIVLLSAWSFPPERQKLLFWLTDVQLRQLNFGLAEIAIVLGITLPSAIILWCEPDIQTDAGLDEATRTQAVQRD
jgi:hypothetical protein